jgi:hypothetical protein
MKRLTFILFLYFLFSFCLFSQTTVLSTIDKDYDVRDMGLTTNYLWPGECAFYWGGIFNTKQDCFLDSIQIALAFEHYTASGDTNDIMTIDIFRVNKSYQRLKRYVSYDYDLGNLGFPKRFSSNIDNIPGLLTINFRQIGLKLAKLPANDSFFIGIRFTKFHKTSPYETGGNRYLLPDYGLNMGIVGLGGNNLSYKQYSRRYVFLQAEKEVFSQNGTLVTAWYKYDYALYLKAFVSTTNNTQGYEIIDSSKAAEPPGIKCSGIVGINPPVYEPTEYQVYQNYPNPFNPTTSISYTIPQRARVVIDVYSILGQKVRNLIDTYQDRGFYSIPFDATNLNSGTYMYKINIFNGDKIIFSDMKKMLFVK